MTGHIDGWRDLPEPILSRIFSLCSVADIARASRACVRWYEISCSNSLWRGLLCRQFKIPSSQLRGKCSDVRYKNELYRLSYTVPTVCTQQINEHKDEVLHVSFSNSGDRFVTCSKDGAVIVWRFNARLDAALEFYENMKKYEWKYTWSSKFNSSDTLMLVAGVQGMVNGEIAVFKVEGTRYEILCKVANNPYDVMGDWVSDFHFFSCRFIQMSRFGHPESSAAVLFMCEADPTLPPDILHPQSSSVLKNIVLSLFPTEENTCYMRYLHVTNRSAFHPDKPFSGAADNRLPEEEGDANLDQVPNENCQSVLREKDICLIFLTNTRTLAPHQLGFCKIGSENAQRIHHISRPDRVLDMDGHIIGMAVSPDSRLLYVNVRRWPQNSVLSLETSPAIAQQIEMRVVDLETLTLLDSVFTGHKGFTSSFDAFYIYIDVSAEYVCSGSEDCAGRIWDRKYGCLVSQLKHDECVSHCALSPTNQQLAVSVSDDFSIKVWKSKALVKQINEREFGGDHPIQENNQI